MGDSGLLRPPSLQPWQRENILAAAAFLRERFGGNPPSDARARSVHDGLLEVLDPVRRKVRLQKEMTAPARQAAPAVTTERRGGDRRRGDRRRANQGPPAGVSERRKSERRSGTDRRSRR